MILLLPGPSETLVLLLITAMFVAAIGFAIFMATRTRRSAAAAGAAQPLAPGPVGFAVLYRWRLTPGREEEFQVAWERLTRGIREQRGGLGSRLHRGTDGIWWAYAQWPSEDRWRAAQALGPVDAESSARMGEAILERFEPIVLRPVADLLALPVDGGPPAELDPAPEVRP